MPNIRFPCFATPTAFEDTIADMNDLTRDDLFKLEDYATARDDFRAKVLAHKRVRSVALGPHMSLLFEDRLTIQYQVQEMLRIERIFEADAIQDELDAYNPLIPDAGNLKATMLIEYPDRDQRTRRLVELAGIEHRVHLDVDGHGTARTHADEDLPRGGDDKTSAVHFLRFELTPAQAQAVRDGAAIHLRVDHAAYQATVTLAAPTLVSLRADLAAAPFA